jgi:branched-chain amino acid aminotransferase
MTGTPFCMLPVTSLNGIAISDGKVGAGFNRLISQWSANTDLDIVRQIQGWANTNMESSNAPTPYRFKTR